MTTIARAYLRASTAEQDAERAKEELKTFAANNGLRIVKFYVENESGATLKRPKLFELLDDCEKGAGDVLLVEQVDRLSRLNADDWKTLLSEIKAKGVHVVALDLPTSKQFAKLGDETTGRIMEAVNNMLLDVLAAMARKDYEDRKRRTSQGREKAKAEGRYRGRPEDEERNARLMKLLASGVSWKDITATTGASSSTLARLSKRMKEDGAGG